MGEHTLELQVTKSAHLQLLVDYVSKMEFPNLLSGSHKNFVTHLSAIWTEDQRRLTTRYYRIKIINELLRGPGPPSTQQAREEN